MPHAHYAVQTVFLFSVAACREAVASPRPGTALYGCGGAWRRRYGIPWGHEVSRPFPENALRESKQYYHIKSYAMEEQQNSTF